MFDHFDHCEIIKRPSNFIGVKWIIFLKHQAFETFILFYILDYDLQLNVMLYIILQYNIFFYLRE